MAEGTYEYECMRAELLGLEKPDKEDFLRKQKERLEAEDEQIEDAIIEEIANENEHLKNVSGGLDELNSILSSTQKKLHRFKSACGSLTNLLKVKVGHGSTDSISKTGEEQNGVHKPSPINKEISIEISSPDTTERQVIESKINLKKQDMGKAMDNSLDKLDSLIYKAENAQYSMSHQNKQMKSFLNK